MGESKLTKRQIRNLARTYVADLLEQEQMPDCAPPMSETEAEAFLAEIHRISHQIRPTPGRQS